MKHQVELSAVELRERLRWHQAASVLLGQKDDTSRLYVNLCYYVTMFNDVQCQPFGNRFFWKKTICQFLRCRPLNTHRHVNHQTDKTLDPKSGTKPNNYRFAEMHLISGRWQLMKRLVPGAGTRRHNMPSTSKHFEHG